MQHNGHGTAEGRYPREIVYEEPSLESNSAQDKLSTIFPGILSHVLIRAYKAIRIIRQRTDIAPSTYVITRKANEWTLSLLSVTISATFVKFREKLVQRAIPFLAKM